ncbi:MAG: hypothetical protein FWC41_00065 [Firmicutes bacterium]|nr:hypothetical protein [Bacillota bacterium]
MSNIINIFETKDQLKERLPLMDYRKIFSKEFLENDVFAKSELEHLENSIILGILYDKGKYDKNIYMKYFGSEEGVLTNLLYLIAHMCNGDAKIMRNLLWDLSLNTEDICNDILQNDSL